MTDTARPDGARGLPLVTALMVTALIGAALGAVLLVPLHHDIGWPLHVARKILAGESLYGTIIEINPPLIFWYALLAEVVGEALGTGGIVMYHLLSTGIVLTGIFLTWRLLGLLLEGRPYLRAASIVLFAFLAGPFAGYQFGQREHLLFATLVPYLFGAVAELRGRRLSGSLLFTGGLLTAFGLAMKPFFLPIWVGTELLVWRRAGRRSLLRPQALGVLSGFVAYGCAALVFARDYLRIARWGMDAYAYFFPTPLVDILLSWQNGVALVAVAAILLAPRVREIEPMRALSAFAIVILTLAVYYQRKGWDYHWYPVLALAGLVGGTLAAAWSGSLARTSRAPRAPRTGFLALALVLLVAGLFTSDRTIYRWAALNRSPYYLDDMTEAVAAYVPSGTVLPLTTTMQVTVPLVNYTGLTQASRFAAFWMLPAIYHDVSPSPAGYPYHARAEMDEMEGWVFDAVIEDLSQRPDLLIVDVMPPGRDMLGFDYLAYFGQSPAFRALLSEYRQTTVVGGRYRVFERTDRLAHSQ